MKVLTTTDQFVVANDLELAEIILQRVGGRVRAAGVAASEGFPSTVDTRLAATLRSLVAHVHELRMDVLQGDYTVEQGV